MRITGVGEMAIAQYLAIRPHSLLMNGSTHLSFRIALVLLLRCLACAPPINSSFEPSKWPMMHITARDISEIMEDHNESESSESWYARCDWKDCDHLSQPR